MISQNKRKAIRLLEQKKRRDTESLFVAEGRKVVGDLLRGGMRATYIAATPERIDELGHLTAGVETVEATTDEIAEVSALQTRSEIIAIFRKPSIAVPQPGGDNLIIALDGIQDPGNMGAIIRTADWFGVTDIVCSTACADAFDPRQSRRPWERWPASGCHTPTSPNGCAAMRNRHHLHPSTGYTLRRQYI